MTFDEYPESVEQRHATRDAFVASELVTAGLDPACAHDLAAAAEEACLDGVGPFFRVLYAMIDRRLAWGAPLPGEGT